jgi:SAM-dependent methyltransferase
VQIAQAARSSYDDIADMYHSLWANWYLPAALPALEKLFFSQLSAGSRVLDLCCGSGHVTRELVDRGYAVTGVDASAALIAIARRELPQVDFRVQDARALVRLSGRFDGVLSTFDSLNHILKLGELRGVFRGVRDALKPGGLLVFDMNLEEAYSLDLRQWSVEMSENNVGLMRGTYDFATKRAITELIWFVETSNGLWRQHRSTVEQRCYTEAEISLALEEAGFSSIQMLWAREAGMRADLGFGRVFFVARA